MYKCECRAVFEDPAEYIEDTGEIFLVCPCCFETNFDEVKQCEICGEYFEPFNKAKICDDCAEDLYTDRLGLQYLDKHRDFYLEYYGVEKVSNEFREDLIGILEREYQRTLDMDTDGNIQLQHLRNYILEDIDDWIDFLEEEGEI